MDIEVEYKDTNGDISNVTHHVSRLAFIKHLALAGQGYATGPQKLMRTLGMLLHYSNYLQSDPFYSNYFSRPSAIFYDPTEIGQFSNLAGKAIADFLSKKINNSRLTINYEAAMRVLGIPIVGDRPDLIAFSDNWMFALEAKGYTGGPGNMVKHKEQAQSGDVPVHFTVASVAYGLYNRVRCKYYDPINSNVKYDYELLNEVSKKYYTGFMGFLNDNYFYVSETIINEEKYFEVRFRYRQLEKLFNRKDIRFRWFYEFSEFDAPSLLLTKKIETYATEGLSSFINTKQEIPVVQIIDPYFYIDADGIGLKLR
jgi:hypothetical protein